MPRPKSKPSEVRSRVVGLRLREQEWAGLKTLAAQLDQPPSRLLRRLLREALTGGPDYFTDELRELHRMRVELSAIGRNLNQLARAANQGEALAGEDVRRVINAGLVQTAAVEELYVRGVEAARRRAVGAVIPRGDRIEGRGKTANKIRGRVRMRYEAESFTGLEDARLGSRPRGRRKWTGTVGQRARASRRLPQAVFKISSYSHSGGAVLGRVQYITREGELEAEGPNGERLDQVQLAHMVDVWSREAEAGRGRRLAMSAFVSFPADEDKEKATEAARQFFRAAFADNHDYVMAVHTDTKNFHVHVVVQVGGHDGKQLRIGREDLQDLRLLMAEKAAEQGIELDASPRWARGLEQERRPGVKIEGILRRFQSPEHALERAWLLGASRRTQLEALAEVRGGPDADRPPPARVCPAGEHLVTLAQGQEESAEKVQTMKAGWS